MIYTYWIRIMHINSSTWYIPKIEKKKLKELSKRSDRPGLIHFLLYFSSLIFFGYLSFLFIPQSIHLLFLIFMKQFIVQLLKLAGLMKFFCTYHLFSCIVNQLALDGVIHFITQIHYRQKANMIMKLKFQDLLIY